MRRTFAEPIKALKRALAKKPEPGETREVDGTCEVWSNREMVCPLCVVIPAATKHTCRIYKSSKTPAK